MHKRFGRVRVPQVVLLLLFAMGTLAASATVFVQPAKAATFTMETGYYVGTGAAHTVSGLGFQPDMVIVKSSSTAGPPVYKTSSMPSNTSVYLSATASVAISMIVLNSDGFVIDTTNAGVNTSGTLYTWTAFGGSDCTSGGSFCVGTYTGTGTGTPSINTGFQPGLVINKRTTNVAGHFKTTSMSGARSEYFATTAANTTSITALTSSGFTIGTTDNASAGVFYFAAFKTGTGFASEGTYAGDGTDNRSITGAGFKPDAVFVKNSTAATGSTNLRAVMRNNQQPTNGTSFASDASADLPNSIQDFESNGFQIGTNVSVNESAVTFYWFAFKGVPAQPGGSGTFKMASGTYTGTGAARSITGIGFRPDVVIIKDTGANYTVFTTSLMPVNSTAYISNNGTANAAGFITSLDSDGFTVGTVATINGSARTYYWQAFGNAYRPDTKAGAADFAIGVYNPTATDDTSVPGAPYRLDFLMVKQNGSQYGAYRSSEQSGDLSATLSTATEGANIIQSLNPNGFQIGTSSAVNVVGGLYYWFGFKASSNFVVGSYTGDGVVNKAVTIGSGLQPDLIWAKSAAGAQPYARPALLAGDASLPFSSAAVTAGRIKTITSTGMTIGNDFEINSSGTVYRYMAWRIPSGGVLSSDIVDSGGATVASPSFAMNSTGFPYDCTTSTGVLGTSAQRIRLSNLTTSPGWSVSIAATDGATALWRNTGNTKQFDYNDASGCTDGGDTDSFAGKLRIAPSGATLTPQSGCSASNITLGSDQDFVESSVNAITLMSASTGASTNCYWDLTNIQLEQTIPANQSSDSYNINLTLTTIAS